MFIANGHVRITGAKLTKQIKAPNARKASELGQMWASDNNLAFDGVETEEEHQARIKAQAAAAASISDETFMQNVHEARSNGFDLVCVQCGVGMEDDDFENPEEHETGCPNRGRDRLQERLDMIQKRMS